VQEQGFEVVLSFKNVQEQLVVPYDAIVGFFDPSVQFGLKFEAEEGAAASVEPAPPPDAQEPRPVAKSARKPAQQPLEAAPEAPDENAPKVISLDAFRKKP
jgi:hypothetical protein